MSRPLTICAIGSSASTHIATRLQWFAKRGHRVFLLTTSPNPAGIDGVTQVKLNDDSLALGRPQLQRLQKRLPQPVRGAVYHVLYVMAFLRAVRSCRPDVFHVHSVNNYHAWLAALVGCRPLVVTVMGSDVAPFENRDFPTTAGEWMTLRLLREADYITPASDFLVSVVNRLGDFHAKTERIVWGVSLEKFRRRDAATVRAALGLVREARVILSTKILRPFYRVHLVVEAMAIVRRSHPEAVLVMTEYAADPAYREEIERRVTELGLEENVRFAGVVDSDDMPSYYSLADVSVAIPPRDGMPLALLESLACETPHILSRLPRYEEIVQHEESAYFVDPDPESIAAGIVRLLEDDTLRSGMAQHGRRIVEEQANLDEQAAHVEERLRELVATTRPRTFSFAALTSAALAAARVYLNFRRPDRSS